MQTGKDGFLVKEWLAADADPRVSGDVSLKDGVSCDGEGCVVAMADGTLVTQALRPEALADDCERAVLIVTASQAPHDCAAAVIDRGRLRRQGALALRRTAEGKIDGNPDGFDVEAVRPRGVDRPWSPGAGALESDAATLSRPAAAARAKDATPAESDLQPDD
jgi:competence protein ComEC